MKFWLDAQLPPALAKWLTETFGVEATALRELELRDASDLEIFNAARQAKAIVISKDSDFAELVYRLGAPPQIVWVTCGNASNAHIKLVLEATFRDTIKLLEAGEILVEIAEKTA